MKICSLKLKDILTKISKNKMEYLILLFILLLATFLRFYKIPETLGFFGDEGRDALVVKRMIVDHKFTLIGPVTSVGNMYLGPLYYYLMIIPMWLSGLNPISAAYMVAFIGIMTVFLVYFIGKKMFDKKIGLLAAFLYSISTLVVKNSRSSWNPNPMPFFVLLLILSLYRVYVQKKYHWLILTGVAFACATQMHYFALALLPFITVIWFLTLKEEVLVNKNKKLGSFILATGCLLLTSLLLSLPLIIFDFRHNFINFKAINLFFSERRPDFSLIRTLKNIEGRTYNLIGELFTLKWDKPWTLFFWWGILIGGMIGFLKKEDRKPTLLICLWLLIGIFGLAAYFGDIYSHYLGFLFPAPFFLISLFLISISKKIWGKVVSVIMIGFFIYLNLANTPFNFPLYWNVAQVKKLAQKIADDVDNPRFNVVWISSLKDYRAMNYRYFLEILGKKPLEPEDYSQAEALYVVVEGLEINPVDYPIWEIQSMGKTVIEKMIKVQGEPAVYKLVRQ